MMPRRRLLTGLLCIAALSTPAAMAEKTSDAMIRVRLGGRVLEGKVIAWDNRQVNLLARDGQLQTFSPDAVTDFSQIAPRFSGYRAGEMRSQLHAEFGRGFDVASTGHYLVVHPKGQKNLWANRFEDLYRAFVHYFRVRGLKAVQPDYPLVAVVFPNRAEYQAYAASIGERVSPSYLGHYSARTNRVYLFDTSGENAQGDWSQNADTIIHEATHQTAYNTGIHTRFNDAPRWLVEGLATMFEAPGVWQPQSFRTQSSRINRGRLLDFKHHVASRPEGWMEDLIASDDVFRTNPQGAYAEAWALSFYLSETRPRQYAKYLAAVAARPQFRAYSPAQRLADFKAAFGGNLKLLDAQFLRYMAGIR